MERNIHKIIAALLLAAAFTGFVLDGQQTELSGKIIRLHVVGASDSEYDQNLKLHVKDEIVAYLDELLDGAQDKSRAIAEINGHISDIESAAAEAAEEYGSRTAVKCTVMREPFPTRGYDTFSLPAGYYTSVRVTLGEGNGRNWWCVIYPQVCTDAVTDKEDIERLGLSDDEASLMTQEGGYAVKFRFMEIIEKIKLYFAEK